MNRPTIYLAGPVQHPADGGHAWRTDISERFDECDWLNPLSKYDGPAENVHIVEDIGVVEARHEPREYLTSLHGHRRVKEDGEIHEYVSIDHLVKEDKAMIDEADAVLVGWSRVPSVGTPMEVLYAHRQETPVVVWMRWTSDGQRLTRDDLSPWMIAHASKIESSPLDALDALQEVSHGE